MELITHLHVAGELQRAHLFGVYTAATLLDHKPDSGAHHPLTSLRGAAVYHYADADSGAGADADADVGAGADADTDTDKVVLTTVEKALGGQTVS